MLKEIFFVALLCLGFGGLMGWLACDYFIAIKEKDNNNERS